jgi:hypothetical protein
MERIDITMTGVLRPKILKGTLINIYEKVCKGDTSRFRLIINIDPIGEPVKAKSIIPLAEKWFKVVWNVSSEPSFPKAVKWVWSQAEAPYIFHWEDDVDILRDIDVDDMIQILNKYNDLSSLRLSKHPIPTKEKIKMFECFWNYKSEGFYLASNWERQFGLNPILIKKEFIKEAVNLMREDINPEKQFRASQKYMKNLIKKWTYGLYAKPGDLRLIDGRKGQRWKDRMGFSKPKNETFLRWNKV